MSILQTLSSTNISYFTVPLVFMGTCIGPFVFAIAKAGKAYDIAYPRTLRDGVAKSETLSKETKQLIFRAVSASENGFESIGVFTGAVVAANQVGLDTKLVNCLAGGYLAARIAFVFAYVWVGKNRELAWMRPLCFASSVTAMLSMWVMAGLKAAA